jgi:hypothetical protein
MKKAKLSNMVVMLDTPVKQFELATQELNCPTEQLLTPLTRRRLYFPDKPFAVDNGAFARFDEKAFLSLLERLKPHRDNCRFVTLPDVWGSALRTSELFDAWFPNLDGWRIAYVCQDGQDKLPIRWDLIDAIFVGGSNDWQHSLGLKQIIQTAKILKKWVHVGRVNTADRFQYFEKLGVNSVDGTGIARYSGMRNKLHEKATRPTLFDVNPPDEI